MIKITDLKIHYGEFVAVDSLSFSVKQGSVFGLIGPNGAGKTTTIKAIATLIEPTYGEILLGTTSVLHDPESARRMLGYMPDFPPVYDDLRVEEFCDLFSHSYGASNEERKKKIEQVLVQTDLISKRKALCGSLSRGMKQRALLAKTLVHDPSILLLDEPGANLDPKARIDLRKLLRQLANEGKTILVSSHVLTELEDLCDEIGIMRDGKMIISGSIDEITRQNNPSKTLKIELVSPSSNIMEVIEKIPSLSDLRMLDQSETIFEVTHCGDQSDAAHILANLVREGIEVVSYSTKQSKVEDLFLEIESGSPHSTQAL
jgi:ABC-2 type transport system ATP-binding protein